MFDEQARQTWRLRHRISQGRWAGNQRHRPLALSDVRRRRRYRVAKSGERKLTMSALHEFQCVPCQAGEPTLTDAEIAELAPQTPEWSIVERDVERRLERVFPFQDFASA